MGGEAGVDLDQVHLPDPVEQRLSALLKRVEALETAARSDAGFLKKEERTKENTEEK
jgi:hypothetical protein